MIFMSDDGRALSHALRLVRNLGRVLVLGSVGPIDFDVYPDVHKRSLQVIGAPGRPDPSPQLIDFAKHLLASGAISLEA